ncbi:M16 family metallopeptidase [Pseudoalteromonas tunicata]|jgi:predicted Zn-dependent peptidase|uniref:M16 family metallopeptidase n=1 Tax=Pseudoalteromonas tunicata TaxID=314281 RepID=UPI000BBF5683|nr:pitrilysin family protein [Pseudoalteromonas tunicata]ATC93188.1 hypothetical protein PTUN_a0388 [Pseudoalteromonas tunicata]MDP4983380.1 insulinase family protein [Pseudoalteromonas tunicata]
MKMISKWLKVSVLIVSSISATAFAAGSSFKLPQYERLTLDNGLTVYLLEQHEVPLINMAVVIKTGAKADGAQQGLAYLTNESLMLGTTKASKNEIEEKLDFLGANVYVATDHDASQINASFAAKDQATVMALVRDMVLQPSFTPEEFDKFKVRHQSVLSQQKESPRSVIGRYFNGLYYQQHSYAQPVSGDENTVAALNVEAVTNFYQQWYKPNNAAVIVSGDFNSAAMKVRLQAMFASWPAGELIELTKQDVVKPQQAKVLLVNKADANETTFLIGGAGVAKNAKDYVQLQVINTILGGRFTSWLNDELRVNTGLTYGARSQFNSQAQAGTFYISTFTKTATTIEAIDLALTTYQKLWSLGIDEATLNSAKSYVKGQLPPRYETSDDLANFLADMYVYGIEESMINQFEQSVNELTVARSKELIAQYFPAKDLQFVLIGKADELREPVKKYGAVQEVEITRPGYQF